MLLHRYRALAYLKVNTSIPATNTYIAPMKTQRPPLVPVLPVLPATPVTGPATEPEIVGIEVGATTVGSGVSIGVDVGATTVGET